MVAKRDKGILHRIGLKIKIILFQREAKIYFDIFCFRRYYTKTIKPQQITIIIKYLLTFLSMSKNQQQKVGHYRILLPITFTNKITIKMQIIKDNIFNFLHKMSTHGFFHILFFTSKAKIIMECCKMKYKIIEIPETYLFQEVFFYVIYKS